MTSNPNPQQPKFTIRPIFPVSRSSPCYIDFQVHPYHIYHGSTFLLAFSSLRCAEHSIELGIIHSCPSAEIYQLIKELKILDIVSGLEYRRMGTTWEPVNGVNMGFRSSGRVQ